MEIPYNSQMSTSLSPTSKNAFMYLYASNIITIYDVYIDVRMCMCTPYKDAFNHGMHGWDAK